MVDAKRSLEDYLVASARLGDRKAMVQLVELRGPRLLVHAARLLGDREEARDAVQDAWIDILRSLKSLRDVQAFPAWATRIVTRRCAGLIRNKQGQRALANALAHDRAPDDQAVTENGGMEALEADQVRRAIAALPSEQSATIALFYLEDMSVADVSVAMDVPVGTVKTRLMQARTKLRHALKGENDE